MEHIQEDRYPIPGSIPALVMRGKEIIDNIAAEYLKPTVRENPKVVDENPFDMENPLRPDDDEDLMKYCDKEYLEAEVYPDSPSDDSLDEEDDDEDDDKSLLSSSDEDEPSLSFSKQESTSPGELMNVSSDDEGKDGDHQSLAVQPASSVLTLVQRYFIDFDSRKGLSMDGENLTKSHESKKDGTSESEEDSPNYVAPLRSDSVVSTFSPTDESDDDDLIMDMVLKESEEYDKNLSPECQRGRIKRKGSDIAESPKKRKLPEGNYSPYTDACISVPSLNLGVLSLQENTTGMGKSHQSKKAAAQDDSPSCVPKKTPLGLDTVVSTFSSANESHSPDLQEKIHNQEGSDKFQYWTFPELDYEYCNIMDIFLEESEEYNKSLSEKCQRGGVKRQGSDTVESSKKRKPLEGAYSPYTETGITTPSLNLAVLSLQEKTSARIEMGVSARELEGVKRQGSDILGSPKKQKLSDETTSPGVTHSKDGIPVSFSNPNFLAWVKNKMCITPESLKQLEDEVIKAISSTHVSYSNLEVLDGDEVGKVTQEVENSSEMGKYLKDSKLDKKKPVDRKDDGKPMDKEDSKSTLKYLNYTKRRIEDNLKHLKLLITLVDRNLKGSNDYLEKGTDDPACTGYAKERDANKNEKDGTEINTNDNEKDATKGDTNDNEKYPTERDTHHNEKNATGKDSDDNEKDVTVRDTDHNEKDAIRIDTDHNEKDAMRIDTDHNEKYAIVIDTDNEKDAIVIDTDNGKVATKRNTNYNEKDAKEKDTNVNEKDVTIEKGIKNSNEIDPKSPCLKKKLNDDSLSGKENRKRNSKSKFPVNRITSPLSNLNQALDLCVLKRQVSPSSIEKKKTKVRKKLHRKAQTP